ncbi:M66 family metalloprotease [uncultured Ruegeria sp.]|uniref:M66 family metalloprotease n=1 Tax=uncultured Ruegeria sp. TaxID=259304 RepID=UPI002612A8F4|nr:M66 family metalloprotease [uncultured Ruegeria sp.]
MEIRTTSFNYPKLKDGGPQGASTTIRFSRRVLRATSGVTGYSARFENNDDHHLGRLIVESAARIDPDDDTQVIVAGSFGLRDWSGDWDDHYSGNIQVAVLVELEAVAPPAPGAARGDLTVTGAEITQAIQHFRSAEHLDGANVFADNTIRLSTDKPTVIRVWVDYDSSTALPNIARLSGELTVTSGGTATSIAPLEQIDPRRASTINRRNRLHTLNFLIPENLCRGTVQTSVAVFDASDSSQFSRPLERELTFETFPALPIMAVGINYTGPDMQAGDQTAPTMADFVDLFGFTEATFPIPEVDITTYLTMDYDKETISDISDGCDKLGDMKDAVADMRGDSNDIVYGLFNNGVATGSVGGCGGGGVAVGRIGAQGTAAHEVGHALGRKHAPCDNVTRCAEPKNPDGDYPDYSGFDSDSIGEYGFDPRSTTGRVVDPGNAHDFMGYSGNRWISPYTYKALMSRIPEEFPTGASAAASAGFSSALTASFSRSGRLSDGEWIPIKQPQLFLRIDVQRDRSVNFHPAFHFDALPRGDDSEKSNFVVDLLDENGKVLRSACVFIEDVGCGCSCNSGKWPMRIRQAVPFHPKARKLVLYECEDIIGSWPVTDAPTVNVAVSGTGADRDTLEIRWELAHAPPGAEIWYLVQWRDRRGTWRGLAPRTQANTMSAPKRLFWRQKTIAIRVLATTGISTGEGHWEGSTRVPPTPPTDNDAGGSDVDISIAGIPAATPGTFEIPALLRSRLLHRSGATVPTTNQRWYGSDGGEIGRGRHLDLRNLKIGEHLITATVLEVGMGVGSGTWHVERTKTGRFLLHIGDRSKRSSNPDDCRPDNLPPDDDHNHDHEHDDHDDHDDHDGGDMDERNKDNKSKKG